MSAASHALDTPSAWVTRWAPLIPRRGRVLDLASGRGRHARYLAARGHPVLAADRDAEALAALAGVPGVTTREVDLEAGERWPFADARFAGIVVTNYLHRPLLPALAGSLEEGGVLIYETFMRGNERYGRPSNPDFLLVPAELLEVFGGVLTVAGFEQGTTGGPRPAVVQRFCAARASAAEIRLPDRGRTAEIG